MLLCISASFTKLILLKAVPYTGPDENENTTSFLNKVNWRK